MEGCSKVGRKTWLGIYSYYIETLKEFVSFNQSKNELANRLEQLRALDNNIRIDVALIDKNLFGIDTLDDLERIRKIL